MSRNPSYGSIDPGNRGQQDRLNSGDNITSVSLWLVVVALLFTGAVVTVLTGYPIEALKGPSLSSAEYVGTFYHPQETRVTQISPGLTSSRTYNASKTFSVERVDCGFGLMRLACNVTVHASPAYSEDDFYLEYAPAYHSASLKTVRSKTFTVNNESTGVKIFRLRAQTIYWIRAFRVTNSDQIKEYSDTVTFQTAATGYSKFDEGPINIVSGTPNYPLLNFALHSKDFRGAVATDAEGYVVWYYNASVEFNMAHVIAVEQSNKEHIWCINDAGYESQGIAVRIIDAMGEVLALKKESDVTGMSGHECRFTDGIDNIEDTQRVLLLTSTANQLNRTDQEGWLRHIGYRGEKYLTEYSSTEFIRIYGAYETGIRLVQNISLDQFLRFEDLLDFYSQTDKSGSDSHEWNDLILEFSEKNVDLHEIIHYQIRYIHASSVSVAEDGSLYIVTFRDSHIVVGIDRKSHSKKFLISSVIPNLATHEFQNDFHKFYAPHDVSYHANSTLCLIDDGYARPQGACTNDDTARCFSRAVCYSLDDDAGIVHLEWEFEYPHEMVGVPLNKAIMKSDLYNLNGGSLRRVGVTEWVASFTSVEGEYANSSWAFGLKQNSQYGINVTSIVQMPRCEEWNDLNGASGSYRATPLISINGETDI